MHLKAGFILQARIRENQGGNLVTQMNTKPHGEFRFDGSNLTSALV